MRVLPAGLFWHPMCLCRPTRFLDNTWCHYITPHDKDRTRESCGNRTYTLPCGTSSNIHSAFFRTRNTSAAFTLHMEFQRLRIVNLSWKSKNDYYCHLYSSEPPEKVCVVRFPHITVIQTWVEFYQMLSKWQNMMPNQREFLWIKNTLSLPWQPKSGNSGKI